MHHVAIMKKSWGLLPKLIAGEKTIESRWYMNKHAPWDAIKPKDEIYFKNSGETIITKATVSKVLRFSDLTPKRVKEILFLYGQKGGIAKKDIPYYYKQFKNKHYCLLIFLKNAKPVTPFQINKKGFGAMAAWVSVDDIKKIKMTVLGQRAVRWTA